MEKVLIVKNAEYLIRQKKDCGFKFIHLALEATVADLKKKAIELFFLTISARSLMNVFWHTGSNIVTVEISIK